MAGSIRWLIPSTLLISFCLFAGGQALAVDFKTLVMPGPLIQGHAEAEKECGNCHASFEGDAQSRLCIACHEEVGDDVQKSQGFHGRAAVINERPCRDCHTDHEGRKVDIVAFDPGSFDHDNTDFALVGAHQQTRCGGCHQPGKLYRAAPGTCVDCHAQSDVHKGKLGEECADCHEATSWKGAEFDHAKTKFPLEHSHRKVDCGLCHPNQRYTDVSSDCVGCHRISDVHRGTLGPDCQSCHTVRGWKDSSFDHAKETRFARTGKHAELGCESCHKGDPATAKPKMDCIACHRSDDEHRGRNGPRCETCHTSAGWGRSTFDHDKVKEFPLRGAHADARCDLCHKGVAGKDRLPTRCEACHAGDDVHSGQLGDDCGACHNERDWAGDVFFDHELTRFPLLGLHALVTCEECHASGRFMEAETSCSSCHRGQDVHKARLGDACARCHNPNGWRIWNFDHNREASFALHGSHEGLDCHSCHKQPVKQTIQLSSSCHSCHAKDDVHAGKFGRACGQCHHETVWTEVKGIR